MKLHRLRQFLPDPKFVKDIGPIDWSQSCQTRFTGQNRKWPESESIPGGVTFSLLDSHFLGKAFGADRSHTADLAAIHWSAEVIMRLSGRLSPAAMAVRYSALKFPHPRVSPGLLCRISLQNPLPGG